jgi:hypothetical protein
VWGLVTSVSQFASSQPRNAAKRDRHHAFVTRASHQTCEWRYGHRRLQGIMSHVVGQRSTLRSRGVASRERLCHEWVVSVETASDSRRCCVTSTTLGPGPAGKGVEGLAPCATTT